jgi:hypothetical protein
VPEQLRLWRIGTGELLEEVARAKLDLEDRIESWISTDISIIDPNLLVVGRQVQTDYAGYIDLLCIDPNANLVIVELKRGLTPRDVTAQALDYASWVKDLTLDRLTEIANNCLGNSGLLEAAFLRRFNEDLPETVNENHSIIVVASDIDQSTERIMRYLSDSYGVGINAVQFQYYRTSAGQEFLARLFLIEPDTVESQTRSKSSSKRRRNLTFDEVEQIANDNGVSELYRKVSFGLSAVFAMKTRISQIAFKADIGGSMKVVFSLLPANSSASDGLCYQAYSYRLSHVLGIPVNEVPIFLPPGSKPWIYYSSAPDDYKGFMGYFQKDEQVDKFLEAMQLHQ